MAETPPIVVAVSGASGAPIAVRLLEWLHGARVPVALVVSAGGRKVLKEEAGIDEGELAKLARHVYPDDELAAPIASGTQPTRGMVVVPCSSNTVARIALGLGDTLISRAAHVHLKERRPLVVVPRETPLPTLMLRHLTTLSELGVVVLAAAPAYYLHPRSIDDVTDYLVGKVLDRFGLRHRLYRPWGSEKR
ncbi:MAG: UbiX family flavin prenyltransferase [Thermoplasmata archaeon]